MYDKYLPIGTVVLLKNATKKIMITGFCSIANGNKAAVYDYSGCLYPEGYLEQDKVCLFNHNQIDKIYYLGFRDEEEKSFKSKLNDFIKNFNNQNE